MSVRALFFATLCGFAPPAVAQVPTIDEIEQKIIAYRAEHYHTGFVDLVRSRTRQGTPAEGFRYRIWFDPERIRFDWQARSQGTDSGKEYQIAVTEDKYIWNPPSNDMITVAPRDEYPDVYEHFGIFQPKSMGLGVNSVIQLRGEDESQLLQRNLDRRNIRIDSDPLNGIAAWRIRYELTAGSGSAWTVWVAPEQGYAVLQTVGEFSLPDGGTTALSVQTEYAETGENKIWFPAKLKWRHTIGDDAVEEEEVEVLEVRLGDRAEEKMFELAGMNIPEGKGIADRTLNPMLDTDFRWTAGTAVQIPPEPGVPVPVPMADVAPAGRWGVLFLCVNAAVFLAIGCYGAMRLLRR